MTWKQLLDPVGVAESAPVCMTGASNRPTLPSPTLGALAYLMHKKSAVSQNLATVHLVEKRLGCTAELPSPLLEADGAPAWEGSGANGGKKQPAGPIQLPAGKKAK